MHLQMLEKSEGHAKLTFPLVQEENAVFSKTPRPIITCRFCKVLDKSDLIISYFLAKSWKKWVGCRISCLTDNVIYLIICLKCRSQYIGETRCKLRQSMYEHIQFVQSYGTRKQATPISLHFNECWQRPAKFSFHILETIRGVSTNDETMKLRCKHEKW